MRLKTGVALALILAGTAPATCVATGEEFARLAVAIEAGDSRTVDRMLAAGFDANFTPNGERSLLSRAIRARNHEAARALLAHGADVDRQEGFYQGTAIMFAADAGDIEMVDLLLEHGAQVDARDGSYGDSAINWASYAGDLAMVQHLLGRGADPRIFGHGNALDIAMRRGFQPLVALLAEAMGETRELTAAEEELAAAIGAGDAGRVGAALDAGASADTRDRYRRPLVAAAARAGRADVLRALIAAGAAVDAPDPIGYTALMEAARDRRVETARLLLEKGADANHVAATSGLRLTPLHLGAIGGSVEVVELLVEHGAKLDVKCSIGTTPLLWGLFEGSTEAGIRLIELGADPTIGTNSGYTASDVAADNDDPALAAAIAGWKARHRAGD